MANNKPEKVLKAGSISVAIWKNTTEPTDDKPARAFRTVTFERNYKDKEGNWQGTAQLRAKDLLPTAHLLQKAYDYINTTGKEPEDEPTE